MAKTAMKIKQQRNRNSRQGRIRAAKFVVVHMLI